MKEIFDRANEAFDEWQLRKLSRSKLIKIQRIALEQLQNILNQEIDNGSLFLNHEDITCKKESDHVYIINGWHCRKCGKLAGIIPDRDAMRNENYTQFSKKECRAYDL
ncbi:MAG: hypothetical protein CVV49_08925 [Spirochaetae bacterium HGW-Spirochaetae-5]|nr:MAG: hypothetical protein CVV49_08925 [Spirochaetae bacterium HGW-Spirochaetae-5]